MRALATYILKGRVYAVMVITAAAVLSQLFPPLSLISGAAVALLVLRNGLRDGVFASLLSGVALIVAGLFSSLTAEQVAMFLVAMAGAVWLPSALAAAAHRSLRSFSGSLLVAAMFGLVAIVLVHVLIVDVKAWWVEQLSLIWAPVIEQLSATMSEAVLQEQLENWAERMTGIMAVGLVFSTMCSLFLARWWQATMFNPGGFRVEFLALDLGKRAAFVAMLCIFAGTFGSSVLGLFGESLMLLVTGVFSLQGIALMHSMVDRLKAGRGWLTAVYVLTFILPMQMMGLLSVAGLMDSWMGIRARFAARSTPRQDDQDNDRSN